jgi:HSP20 family protein
MRSLAGALAKDRSIPTSNPTPLHRNYGRSAIRYAVMERTMAEQQKGVTRTDTGQRQPARMANPLFDLRHEIDSLFDRFFSGSLFGPFGGGIPDAQPLRQRFGGMMPKVDVSETDREIQIVAELPGLKQEDVELILDDDLLTMQGQASESREQRERQFHLTERSYGRFERSFRLPETVERERITAKFENGLLTVTLPKTERAQQPTKRIEISPK